jgi:hypothetical protein
VLPPARVELLAAPGADDQIGFPRKASKKITGETGSNGRFCDSRTSSSTASVTRAGHCSPRGSTRRAGGPTVRIHLPPAAGFCEPDSSPALTGPCCRAIDPYPPAPQILRDTRLRSVRLPFLRGCPARGPNRDGPPGDIIVMVRGGGRSLDQLLAPGTAALNSWPSVAKSSIGQIRFSSSCREK